MYGIPSIPPPPHVSFECKLDMAFERKDEIFERLKLRYPELKENPELLHKMSWEAVLKLR